MEWKSTRFDWNHVRAFLVTAEEGSLSAAARSLGQTQPTLGRQVEALQNELGVLLFDRVGKRLVLTAAGHELLAQARAMGFAATQFSNAALGRSDKLEGTISITASEVYCAFLLPPIINRLRQLAPKLDIRIVATNTRLDLLRREADIALRNVRPEQPDLVAKRLPDDRGHFYASDAYLAEHGPFLKRTDLERASFVSFEEYEQLIAMLAVQGIRLDKSNFPILCANHLVMWELIKSGSGIGVMAEAVGDATPGVSRIECDLPPFDFPVWLTAHREVGMSRRVRFVFDFIADAWATKR